VTSPRSWGGESPNLDVLRANAVFMVLGFHALAFFGIRRLGAFDLEAVGMFGLFSFFVHTTLVLMFSLERQVSKHGRSRLFLIFMARRFFRIYPLSIFVVAVIVLFRLPLAGHPWAMSWPHLDRAGIISNFLLTQNLTWTNSVEGPLWSLPFEVQMYLFLPILFLYARKSQSPWILVAGWALVVTGISAAQYLGHGHLLMYVPCFLAGIIAYRFSEQTSQRWPFWGWLLLLWSSAAVYAVFTRMEVAWLICLLLGMAQPRFVELRHPFVRRASYLISKYSYGFYLSHYFCGWLAFKKLGFLSIESQWIIFTLTVMALPVALYHAVEQPSIYAGKRLVENWLIRSQPPVLARKAA